MDLSHSSGIACRCRIQAKRSIEVIGMRSEGWPGLRSELPMEKDRREGDDQKTSYAFEFCLITFSPKGLYSDFCIMVSSRSMTKIYN